MTETLHERVTELLERAEKRDDEVDEDTLEAATAARDLVETTDPDRLLEAFDLEESATLPQAIAAGDDEAVEDLHALLELAKLADETDRGDGERPAADETDEDTRGDEGDSDLETQLRDSMRSAFDEFGEDVQGFRDHLEELTDGENEGAAANEATRDGTETDRSDEATADSDDEAMTDRDGTSRQSARLSTMAPPPSDRPDMRAVRRHSTMPDR